VIEKLRNFQARKSLGQNFLHDENIARKIINAIAPKPGDRIVEIGPGFGILTRHLLDTGCEVIAIEIDRRLIEELQKKFGDAANLHLQHADFRRVDLASLVQEPPGKSRLRIVGNIPYHITSSIVFAAIRQHHLIRDLLLMVQKEVAERIVASPGSKSYGLLSVLSQTYSEPAVLFHVSQHVFIPKPEVQSAVIHWNFLKPRPVLPADDDFFITLVKRGFNQRRKTLRNALRDLLPAGAISLPVDLQNRAEDLAVDTWIELANALNGGRKRHRPEKSC